MKNRQKKSGFSMVEVALALMVMAVGLTATFALFPKGLELNREATSQTEIGFFAHDVMGALHGLAHVDALTVGYKIDIPSIERWGDSSSQEIEITSNVFSVTPASNEIKEIHYDAKLGGGESYEKIRLKYALSVLASGASTGDYVVRLYVWKADVTSPTKVNATRFYTYIFQPGVKGI